MVVVWKNSSGNWQSRAEFLPLCDFRQVVELFHRPPFPICKLRVYCPSISLLCSVWPLQSWHVHGVLNLLASFLFLNM